MPVVFTVTLAHRTIKAVNVAFIKRIKKSCEVDDLVKNITQKPNLKNIY